MFQAFLHSISEQAPIHFAAKIALAAHLLLLKIRQIEKSLLLLKNRWIGEIPASIGKLAYDRILAGVEIPALSEKTCGIGKAGGPLTV